MQARSSIPKQLQTDLNCRLRHPKGPGQRLRAKAASAATDLPSSSGKQPKQGALDWCDVDKPLHWRVRNAPVNPHQHQAAAGDTSQKGTTRCFLLVPFRGMRRQPWQQAPQQTDYQHHGRWAFWFLCLPDCQPAACPVLSEQSSTTGWRFLGSHKSSCCHLPVTAFVTVLRHTCCVCGCAACSCARR
jgi:hypothetical protein